MTTIHLVSSLSEESLGHKQPGRRLLVTAVRVGFLLAILGTYFFIQSRQPEFINIDVMLPVYGLLMVSFLLNSAYLIAFNKVSESWQAFAFLSAYDALCIVGLMYFTGLDQSAFVFLLLINISLCGLMYSRTGAIHLSFWTSILYSIFLIFGPETHSQNMLMAAILNNIVFFTVALLSGSLSEQFSFLKKEITHKEQDIETLQEFSELIIENISNGLLVVDKDWIITQANPSAEDLLGRKNLLGDHLEKYLPGALDSLQELRRESLVGPKNRVEIWSESLTGEKQLLEVISSSLLDNHGDFRGYVLLIQDLTILRKMESQIRQKEKLAAVGQLAAGIAHEIRNPLASISGSIQLLEGNTASDEDRRLMGIVLKEIDRLNGLITEFLEYVRPEEIPQESVDINEVLKEVLEAVRFNPKLSKEIEQVALLESSELVLGHRDKLKQAFLNIVINAYQAMEKVHGGRCEVSSIDDPKGVKVIVTDTGTGMSESELVRMFEPFHTTKAGGTGLGLAVTHKIFESHGAEVTVESELGRGTRFEILFPSATTPDPEELENVNIA